MTNKLVVIINSLIVAKIKKILLYEISCTKLQLPPEPLSRGLPPPEPRSLCPLSSTEFVELPLHPPNKIPGYATAGMQLILWNGEQRNTKSCTEHCGVNVCRFILCHSACLIHIYPDIKLLLPANGNAKVNKFSCSNSCRQQEQSPSHGYKLLLCIMLYIHRVSIFSCL